MYLTNINRRCYIQLMSFLKLTIINKKLASLLLLLTLFPSKNTA